MDRWIELGEDDDSHDTIVLVADDVAVGRVFLIDGYVVDQNGDDWIDLQVTDAHDALAMIHDAFACDTWRIESHRNYVVKAMRRRR